MLKLGRKVIISLLAFHVTMIIMLNYIKMYIIFQCILIWISCFIVRIKSFACPSKIGISFTNTYIIVRGVSRRFYFSILSLQLI